jgi:hypothetical protein
MASAPPTEAGLDTEAVDAFVAGIRGRVLRPGEPGYDEARAIWNGLIDRRPALIVQCTGAADVVDAVDFAREHQLPLHVDPASGIVRAQGGATWGDCDRESQLHGRRSRAAWSPPRASAD